MFHRADFRWGGVALAVGLCVWLTRLTGPLDLRYDAGVYYLLGTSLAEGKGYRLLNEPGEIEANQYPPLLPAVVAVHQWALGTNDPAVVAVWLRWTYFLLFQLTLLSIYVLACRTIPPPWACAVAIISLLYLKLFFLTDLMFAEVPYLLITVGFILFHQCARGVPAFAGMALCGVAAFLLRTAGVALLAAWVAESLLRREWKQTVLRSLIAIVPVLAWQTYVRRVETSAEYRTPAYPYQRALYQFYNVSYAENILKLKDPFAPELGPATPLYLIQRGLLNALLLPPSLGQVLTGEAEFWETLAQLPPSSADKLVIAIAANLLAGTVGLLMLAGALRRVWQGDWLLPIYLALSLALMCLTPWPKQFPRYVTPLVPFLLLTLVELMEAMREPLRAGWPGLWQRFITHVGKLALLGGLLLALYQTVGAFQLRDAEGSVYDGPNQSQTPRFFYYGREWREFDMGVYWLKQNARPDAVVATSAPHWVYLKTGLKAVMPPYEDDRNEAQRLLDTVPVTYVLVDDLGFLNVMRRYAHPAIKAHTDKWQLVHTVPRAESKFRGRTYIYQRVP